MSAHRPRFEPSHYTSSSITPPPLLDEQSEWLPLISCPASFQFNLFEAAISQLVDHPEYNSTLILRSETIREMTSDFPALVPRLRGKRLTRVIHRRLLARRPERDHSLDQYCSHYTSEDDSTTPSLTDTLVLTPIIKDGSSLPYYHPTVSHLAFRYLHPEQQTLRIEVVPLPGTPTDPNARLYRTCLALLDTMDRYGWGALTHYKKRVVHDCLVPREVYQDLYLVMRERHKHLVGTWQESTDPLKHVFEDIGIATYLMLLWKSTYDTGDSHTADTAMVDAAYRPWISWPRPPGGFLDFGCGNGLLTHILVQEGYEGQGIDLRARTSWSHYPPSTQDHLHVHAFDPTVAVAVAVVEPLSPPPPPQPYFRPGMFVIGNHADELTPWVPVLSTLYSASGYLNLPCCAWSFDVKYERSTTPLFPVPHGDGGVGGGGVIAGGDGFADTLNLGGGEGGNGSSYSMYRIWLASLSLHCGWEIECEMLRIPSTRNWAIVGRKRLDNRKEAMENVCGIVRNVGERGVFKARVPEGKGNNH